MSNRKLWTQKDGTKIRIKDMTDSHIKNTINMLVRNAAVLKSETLLYFPDFHGEMAQHYAEQTWDHLNAITDEDYAEELYPIYMDLVEEQARRENNK